MKNQINLLTAIVIAVLGSFNIQAASHVWSGASSVYFSNPANWSSGGVPAVGEQNVSLHFPPGVARYNPSNDISGLTVSLMSFTGSNYNVLGKSITLAGGTNFLSTGDMNFIYLPFVLGGSNTVVNVAGGKFAGMGAPLSGASHFTKIGAGKFTLNPGFPNTYTGTTFANEGTLLVSGYNFTAGTIPGPLSVGTPSGAPDTAVAQFAGNGKIPSTNVITIYNSGVLDLNDSIQNIGGLVMAHGKVETGTGTLTLFGPVTAEIGMAIINGNLRFYYSNGVFNAVAGGTLNVYGTISSYISDPGIVKTGPGAVNLRGENTFTGPAIVKQGYLGLYHPRALSQSSGLVVTNSGIVQMFGVGITNVPAKLSGNGNGNGCLRAFGVSFWEGEVTLTGNSGVQPFAAADQLTIGGPINGAGNLTKLGSGTLTFAGVSGNSYAGTTTVSLGTLQLSKSNAVAIPGTLVIGDGTNSANSSSIRLMRSNQIDDRAEVTVNASGGFDFTGTTQASETIGSLSGAGNLYLGFNSLAAGSNNLSTTFGGEITGAPAASFIKQGSGTLTVNGNGGLFFGTTQVSGGRLAVNGSLASSTVMVAPGATVAGEGVTGVLGAYGGKIAPGNSAGLLHSANFGMSSASVLELELNGTAPGVTYDQIAVTGFVNLGNANLNVLLGFNSAVSNKFLIVANDGNDAVVNTFKNLSEGATFFAGNAQFQISYLGGDGNDVELTQVGVALPPQIGGISQLPNGQIHIDATGLAGFGYDVEANDDLGTTNWVKIGSAPADPNGVISFSDPSATNYPIRFYRLRGN